MLVSEDCWCPSFAYQRYAPFTPRKDLNLITAIVFGTHTTLAFATIDFYYALNHVISDIYMADGALEITFIPG